MFKGNLPTLRCFSQFLFTIENFFSTKFNFIQEVLHILFKMVTMTVLTMTMTMTVLANSYVSLSTLA